MPATIGSRTVMLAVNHRLRVFDNRVLRKIFGPKRDEVRGEWRTLHSGDLHDPYCLTNINRLIKSRRMKWAGHVALTRQEKYVQSFGGET